MIRIIVCGACGKMGTRILELALNNPLFKVAGAIESKNHRDAGKTILDGKVRVGDDLDAFKDNSADVLIDFTSPAATIDHLKTLQTWKKISAVIGTTGFSESELSFIKSMANKMPVMLSPNMSVGVNVMLQAVRAVASKLAGYDVEIIETHHNQKKDAPSGTALALAKEIADEIRRDPVKDFVFGRAGQPGARNPKEIGIHAVRAGDVVGDHTVIFAAPGERLEIVHRASSRDAFAQGALRAAAWISEQKPGLYSMKEVLSDKK